MSVVNVNNAWMAAYQYTSKTQRNNTAETDSTGFLSAVSEKQAEKTERTSLEDMWKLRYPGAYCHAMDGSEKKYQSSVTDKEEINWDELAFEHAGPNAPQSVKDAWMEASKEAGANGLGYTSNGINVTEMHIQEFLKWYWGGKKAEFQDVLGNSVESAIRAAQQALYSFDHPLEPNKVMSIEEQQARVKERRFYVTFLEKLENLLNE